MEYHRCWFGSRAGTVNAVVSHIIIPVTNEGRDSTWRNSRNFSRKPSSAFSCFVNDGSADGRALLENLGNYDPQRFAIHHLPQNVGRLSGTKRLIRAFDARPDYIGLLGR